VLAPAFPFIVQPITALKHGFAIAILRCRGQLDVRLIKRLEPDGSPRKSRFYSRWALKCPDIARMKTTIVVDDDQHVFGIVSTSFGGGYNVPTATTASGILSNRISKWPECPGSIQPQR
jgi:hypothetical protein